MSRIKKILYWSALVVLLMGAAGWYAYRKLFVQLPGHTRLIPSDATSVLIIKPRQIGLDAWYYGVDKKDTTLQQLRKGQNKWIDSTLLKSFSPDPAAGIIVFEAPFSGSTYTAIICGLEKEPGEELKARQDSGFRMLIQDRWAIGWKEKTAIVLDKTALPGDEACAERLRQLFSNKTSLQESNAFFRDQAEAAYVAGLWNCTGDIPSFFDSKHPKTIKKEFFVSLNMDAQSVYGTWATPGDKETAEGQNPEQPSTEGIFNKTPALSISGYLISTMSGLLGEPTGHAEHSWITMLGGYGQLCIADTVNIRKEIITYTYDDNFNKQEVKTSVNETVPSFLLVSEVRDTRHADSMFSLLDKDARGIYHPSEYLSAIYQRDKKTVFFGNNNELLLKLAASPAKKMSNTTRVEINGKRCLELSNLILKEQMPGTDFKFFERLFETITFAEAEIKDDKGTFKMYVKGPHPYAALNLLPLVKELQ